MQLSNQGPQMATAVDECSGPFLGVDSDSGLRILPRGMFPIGHAMEFERKRS